MKEVKWVLTNGLVVGLLYFALFENAQWAGNAFKFLLWFTFFLYLMVNLIDDIKEKLSKKGMPVPAKVSLSFDLIVSLALASSGWFFYAALNIVQGWLYLAMYSKSKNKK